jgi:NhaP-type Na+/H+ or K+/H+ antiporter
VPDASALPLLPTIAGIFALGVAAQWLAWRVRLPSILLLLAMGLVVGPMAGLLAPRVLLGDLLDPIVALAVGVILFEGGLTLRVRELREIGAAALRLCTLGVACTWALATAGGVWIAGLSFELALLFGALLTVTGPTVIGPLLNHIRPRGRVGPVLKWEGIVADVIGATLSVLVLHALAEGHGVSRAGAMSTIRGVAVTLVAGGFAGGLGAALLVTALRRRWLPDHLESPVTLGSVLAVYALGDGLQHEAGLLSVTLMGFVLANQERVPLRHILEFKENLRTLLLAGLFVVLAATLRREDLAQMDLTGVGFVLWLVLVVRPVSAGLSLWGTGLEWREIAFVGWMAPRGVVAAAVAGLFAARLAGIAPGAERLVPLAFLVILSTVAIYGLTAGPLARRLGLAEREPQGCLFVGGGRFAEALARVLAERGFSVVMVDTNRRRVSELRLSGLQAVWGDVLEGHPEENIPMGGLGRLLALTSNDEVNRLAALHFSEFFERSGVFQLPSQRTEGPGELGGRPLFDSGATFGELERRMAAGARVKATRLTEEFHLQDLRAHHGERSLLLMRITPAGRLVPFVAEEPPSAGPGDIVLHLTSPDPEEEPGSSRP